MQYWTKMAGYEVNSNDSSFFKHGAVAANARAWQRSSFEKE